MKKHIFLIIGILVIIALAIGVAINNHNNQDKPVSELPIVGGNNDVVDSTPPVESDPIVDIEPTPVVPDTTPQKDPDALPIIPDEMDNPEADPTDKNDSEGNSEPQEGNPEQGYTPEEEEKFVSNTGIPTMSDDTQIESDTTTINPEPEITEELTEEELQEWKEYLESLESIVTPTPSNPTQSNPPAEEPTTPPQNNTRTDAEVQAAINEFVATFENLDAVDLTWYCEEGILHLQDNLDIIQNHPEKSVNISTMIENYQLGIYDDEYFYFLLTTWLEGGGLYGGKEITVQ